ncbi:hypothetical protein IJ818_05585 [bacterium]|nr:hypothetical protein [bacterium]
MQNSGNNVLFVTNEDDIVNQLSDQLILLRNIDCILIRLYTDACDCIDMDRPQSIIISCSNRDEEADCLETIKLMKRHTIVPIILVLREYNEDFIKEANKAGISDCVTVEHGHSEILMRTIWSLQKNEMRETHKKNMRLLEQLKIIDEKTGFYTLKQNKRVLENEIGYLTENKLDAVLMGITPNRNSEIKISKERLDETIKKNVRGSDIVVMFNETTYFLILTNTNLSGAMIVWSRITKTLGEDGIICGCITDVEQKPLEQLKTLITNGLEVALTAPNNFIAINEDDDEHNEGRWLKATGDKSERNIKLFKQIFEKKLSGTIKPIFEFAKKSAKRKLPKIEFEVVEDKSGIKMVISKDDKISTFIIEHPGSSYINVSFIHEGLDSPENKTTKMEFNEINETIIKELIDSFVKEYMSYVN